MTISTETVGRMRFRTDAESDKINTKFKGLLGLSRRYMPAKLAIARSLAISAPPDIGLEGREKGKEIRGDTLFSASEGELETWLALLVEHADEPKMDTKRLLALVDGHWRRGLTVLDGEWKLANGDIADFFHRLIKITGLPLSSGKLAFSDSGPVSSTTEPAVKFLGEVNVPIGEVGKDVDTGDNVNWCINRKGGSPHSAIMGQSGSGKTVLAVSMLREVRDQTSIPILAFDFKGDLLGFTGTKNEQASLGSTFKARSIKPPREAIPLDVLHVANRDKYGIDEAASRFRDSFARLKGSQIGVVQQGRILKAADRALTSEQPCELQHVFDHLNSIYEEEGAKIDGAVSKMSDLCRLPFFKPDMFPSEFFKKSWVVDLSGGISEDIQVTVINLILDALYQYLSSLDDAPTGNDGSRALRIICMIDEAHQILGKKLPSLSQLVRMSRSKGGAVMLVSQSPDDFSGEEDEFLDNMGLVAAFSTNARPQAAQRVLGTKAKLTNLKMGECFARVDGATRKVKAWE